MIRRTVATALMLAMVGPLAAEPGDDADDDPEVADDVLPAPAAVGSGTLIAEAHRQLAAVRESHYAHHTAIDESRGVFDYDCSGFVGYALKRVAPQTFGELVTATRPRPLAKDFYAFFATRDRVDHVADLVPGDIIAWLEPPAKHSRNTGHVMVVDQPPVAGANPGELVVAIIDSSHSGHGHADARIRDRRNGLGAGSIVLLVDRDGKPTGYRWSLAPHSVRYATAIALGRVR
ncbi:MAG TPA: hypothetical protein VGG28_11325 [Kofleriaceae bacterium]|jgi:hypothetical protein